MSDEDLFDFRVVTTSSGVSTVRFSCYLDASDGVVYAQDLGSNLQCLCFLKPRGECVLVKRNLDILHDFGIVLGYTCSPMCWEE